MLQDLGDKLKTRRWLGYLILAPIVLIFVVWGAYGVVDLGFGTPNYALKVNGEEVPITTMQERWQDEQSQYQQMFRADMSAEVAAARQNELMNSMVRAVALSQSATANGFRAADDAVLEAMRSQPAFQVGGEFNAVAARAILAQSGLSVAAYEGQLRSELQSNQLMQSLMVGSFLTPTELNRILALENEQRELRFATLPLSRYEAAAKLDEAALKHWYDTHAEDYQTEESARVEYAELTLADVAASLNLDESALTAWYEQNKARYAVAEQRRSSHILIELAVGADPAAMAAAEAKARQVHDEAAKGGDFAALAKQYSADTGSAASGGDVGWASNPGNLVPEYTTALFQLQEGAISAPVKSQFGYHIIKLTGRQGGETRSLDNARAEIETDFRRDRAATVFGDKQEAMQQAVEEGKAGDLAALAREQGLKSGVIETYTRADGGALGSQSELSELVFNADVRSSGRTAGPVALSEERIVAVQVKQYRAVTMRPLAEVRDEVQSAARREQGSKAALAAANEALKQIEGGTPFDATLKSLSLNASAARFVGRGDPQLPVQVRDEAFALAPPGGGTPVYRVVPLEEGGAALLALTAVKAGAASDNKANDQQLISPYSQRHRESEVAAYLSELENSASVSRNTAVFN